MSSISDEIQQLQQRIIELEKQKKEQDEKHKKSSSYNFQIIGNLISEKKKSIVRDIKSSNNSRCVYGYQWQEQITYLEAIYNILHDFNERLTILEDNQNSTTSVTVH
jgi:hypothetical protein